MCAMLSAVSHDNVEVIRSTLAALERALDAYWRDPQPLLPAYKAGELGPEWQEWLSNIHPDTEWRTIFLGETFHGDEECVQVWHDFLRWASDYRFTLDEIADLGGDEVFMAITTTGQGRNSDARMNTRLYSVATVRDGQVTRLAEYTSRDEAMEAAGPRRS
jgi:ketosteroid isomerase-like protein